MVDAAWLGANDADLTVVLVDSRRPSAIEDDDTARIIAGISQTSRRAILALNKVDLVERGALLALSVKLNGFRNFQ